MCWSYTKVQKTVMYDRNCSGCLGDDDDDDDDDDFHLIPGQLNLKFVCQRGISYVDDVVDYDIVGTCVGCGGTCR